MIDVLQAEGAPNKFIFYEIYQSTDDISYHKEQPHYLAWVAFKESGGTISSISTKASGKFLT
jgi:quinol monooxygenase YgiN